VANSPAYYDTATITTVESFIVSASSLTVTVITIFDQKKIYLVIQCSNFNWKLANSFFENCQTFTFSHLSHSDRGGAGGDLNH